MGRYLGILKRTSFQNICFRTDGTSLNSIRMVPGKLSVSHLTRTVLPSSSHLRYLSGQYYIYLYQVYHQQFKCLWITCAFWVGNGWWVASFKCLIGYLRLVYVSRLLSLHAPFSSSHCSVCSILSPKLQY